MTVIFTFNRDNVCKYSTSKIYRNYVFKFYAVKMKMKFIYSTQIVIKKND